MTEPAPMPSLQFGPRPRVLLTGGSGFIGRHAVTPLQAAGFDVHTLGRRPVAALGVTHHDADLLDADAARTVVEAVRATHLLHLAWYVEPGAYWRSPRNLDWVAATLGLVRAFALAGGRRIVAAGTCAEYQWGGPVLDEAETPCVPATLYGACKDALRRMLLPFAAETGLSAGWGRVFYLYGAGEAPGRLVGDAMATLRAGGVFATSHGRQRRDFLHVSDVASAFAALLASPVTGAVNIGSGQAVAVRTVLEQVAHQVGGLERIEFGARALSAIEPDVIEAAIGRLREEVGFRPRHTLASGIAESAARPVRGSEPVPAQR